MNAKKLLDLLARFDRPEWDEGLAWEAFARVLDAEPAEQEKVLEAELAKLEGRAP